MSKDNTLSIVKEYEPKFNGRMKIVSESDAGIYDAMNKGIILSNGSIIGIINSDDWYELNAVELVVDSFKKNGDAVYYGVLRVLENGKEMMLKAINYQFLYKEHLGHPAYFVTKNVYKANGIFSLKYKYASDYELMMRLIKNAIPFIQIDHVLAIYNQGGISSVNGLDNYEEYLKIRYVYGYLTKYKVLLRIMKNRLFTFLTRILGV